MYTVYFLISQKNGKVYVGVTEKDPKIRLEEHNAGCNKWTRENRPVSLVFYEQYHCQQDAFTREAFYKTGIGRKARDAIFNAFASNSERKERH